MTPRYVITKQSIPMVTRVGDSFPFKPFRVAGELLIFTDRKQALWTASSLQQRAGKGHRFSLEVYSPRKHGPIKLKLKPTFSGDKLVAVYIDEMAA